jgi:hypothetical protein
MFVRWENCWHAAAHDLDEAIALAQVIPYPHAELKALCVYGLLHEEMGECAKARKSYEQAIMLCRELGEEQHRPHIERSLLILTSG